jgi:hypothetical protein
MVKREMLRMLTVFQLTIASAWILPIPLGSLRHLSQRVSIAQKPSPLSVYERGIQYADRIRFNTVSVRVLPVTTLDPVSSPSHVSELSRLCEYANATALAGWKLSQEDPTNGRDRDGCRIPSFNH